MVERETAMVGAISTSGSPAVHRSAGIHPMTGALSQD